jgi:hypothetical protein
MERVSWLLRVEVARRGKSDRSVSVAVPEALGAGFGGCRGAGEVKRLINSS